MRRLPILLPWLLLPACASIPKGQTGPAADALAHQIEKAINKDAWDRTGAVQWTFFGKDQHVWDKQRDWIWVRWGDCEVKRHLWSMDGKAWCDGKEVTDPGDRKDLMDDAYAKWVNDAFWLNPLVKLFDKGVTRAKVDTEDGPGLLITFSSGGLTPGDSYLWVLGPDNLPKYWRMWVSIIPIPGMKTTWERWVTLSTGAKVSTLHESAMNLELTDVAGAWTIKDLLGSDPFEGLAPPPPAAEPEPDAEEPAAEPAKEPTAQPTPAEAGAAKPAPTEAGAAGPAPTEAGAAEPAPAESPSEPAPPPTPTDTRE